MAPRRRGITGPIAGLACVAFGAVSGAQFDDRWLELADATATRLGLAASEVSNGDNEVDFAWGDLDRDGWTDLVVARKQPFTTAGRRTNLLLMNESGVLVDRTAQYASASDVDGDQGFLTPTNDRDVALVDVNGDGLLDVVTAPTLSDGAPKEIGHPRIYVNLGFDANDAWRGLRFEAARTPQLFHFTNGSMQNPRFCAVAAGDVTGDGHPDLYFVDYDFGPGSSASNDLNDRLLVNDGNGYFADESQLRMTSQMLQSAFGTAASIVDLNLDGRADIVRSTALGPTYVTASLNDPSNVGTFNYFDAFNQSSNYHVSTGDLNNDGRPDAVVSDDGNDRIRYNLSNDPLGIPVWGPARTFDFLSGNDDSLASNNLVADLDGDGWKDVVICDVDVDFSGCFRRVHVYHNRGGAIGAELVPREERQAPGAGWIGAVGLTVDDLTGGHDVAVFDLDNDGDMDVVLGRCAGTFVWENVSEVCQPVIGFGGPGDARLRVCGDALGAGGSATATVLAEGLPNAPVFLAASLASNPTPLLGGTVVPFPPAVLLTLTTDAIGVAQLPGIPGGAGPAELFVQAAVFDPSLPKLLAFTNAVRVELLP